MKPWLIAAGALVLHPFFWACVWLLSGCASSHPVSSQNMSSPPLPFGVQKPLAVSRAAPAIIGQPKPVLLSLTWAGGSLDRPGFATNLPVCYRVEVSTNLVTWTLLTNVVAPGPAYSVQTLAAPGAYFRYRPAAAWEVSP